MWMKMETQRGSHGAWTSSKIKFQRFVFFFYCHYFSFLVQHFSICTFLCLSVSASESESLDDEVDEDEDPEEEEGKLKEDQEEDNELADDDDDDDDYHKVEEEEKEDAREDDNDEVVETENGVAEDKAMQKIADPLAFP